MLKRCLDSVSDKGGNGCAVTLIDNASGDGVIGQVRAAYPEVRIIEMPVNAGFAAAVNRGIDDSSEPYLLMLNTDAVLTPGSLELMKAGLDEAGPDCAGVAPKMMSSAHPGIIDAVGTIMPKNGASFNRGIGQCDLGQYDQSEEVAGVCFGVTLLRRELFEPERVGPLFEGYFLYFEDSDWCMRACSQGYRFLTAPAAVVYHMHSGVIRNESLAFKYKLVELNTLKVVVRTFDSRRRAAAIVTSRCARLLARTFIRRRFIAANISTLASFTAALPGLLSQRRALKVRRVTGDSRIFQLADGEDAYFDTISYEPDRCLESLIANYERLLKGRKDPETGKRLAVLYRLRQEQGKNVGSAAAPDRYLELFTGETECVRRLLERALGETAPAA